MGEKAKLDEEPRMGETKLNEEQKRVEKAELSKEPRWGEGGA